MHCGGPNTGFGASSIAITGIVQEEMIVKTMKDPDKEMLEWLPNVRMLFDAKLDRDNEFELSVRAVINGLYSQLMLEAQQKPTMAPQQRKRRRTRA